MKLERLTVRDQDEIVDYIHEIEESGEEFVPFVLEYFSGGASLKDVIERCANEENGIGLPEGWVSHTTFFLKNDQGNLLGATNLRHALTPFLEREGGHIGYGIRPKYRKNGYGYKILELGLIEARRLGIEDVLITCDEDNVGSERIIRAHGGEYLDTQSVEGIATGTKRFLISKPPM